MTDVGRDDEAPLFPRKAGERLRAAREERGMSLADVAERTRVPQRHLEAIETSRYDALPAPTYATGFARAYARAVGADEVAIARQVREEAAATARPQPTFEPYVTADPKRLPSRALAAVAAGVALAVLILAAWWVTASRSRRDADAAPAATATHATVTRPLPPPATGGAVRLQAIDTVWVRVYDAGKTLFLGVMKPNDGFDVPAGADHPKLDVGRPDKLRVLLNGAALAPLGNGDRALKGVAIDPVSLGALSTSATPTLSPSPSASPSPRPSASLSARPSATPSARPTRRARDDDTARANRAEPSPTPSASASPVAPPAPAPSATP